MSAGLIPVEHLHPNPANIRRDLGDVTELAASIRAVGLLQPLVVTPRPRGGGFVIIDGHRRLAAARLAGAQAIPCIAAKASEADQQMTLMLAAAMHKELEPLDQAEAFRALRHRRLTVTEIARRTGYSPATVNARLVLTTLPAEAKDMVRHGEITVTQAQTLARHGVTHTTKTQYFTAKHRLAARVRVLCAHGPLRTLIGGVGCGQCWEEAIREEALR